MTTAHGNSIRDDNLECVIVRTAQTLFNTDYGFCSPPRFAIGKPVAKYAGGGEISLNDKTELPPGRTSFFCNKQNIVRAATPLCLPHIVLHRPPRNTLSQREYPSPYGGGGDILVRTETPSCFSNFVLCRPPSTYSVLIWHSLLSRRI